MPWLYCLSYPGDRDHLKVGYTQRTPRARAAEIGGTMAPKTPVVEVAWECDDARRLESLVHRRLQSVRVNGEWFNETVAGIEDAVERIAEVHSIRIRRHPAN
jgi:hypothetical protein